MILIIKIRLIKNSKIKRSFKWKNINNKANKNLKIIKYKIKK